MTRLPRIPDLLGAAGALSLLTLGACMVGDPDPLAVEDADAVDPATKFVRAGEPIPGRYIVVLEQPKDPNARLAMNIPRMVDDLTAGYLATVGERWEAALAGFTAEMDEADAQALAADPRVAFVEEDGVVRLGATQTGATWGLDRIDQTSLPLSGSYTYNNDGSGATVYVVDTGIRATHTDFGGRATAGYTAINDGNGTNDCNGHGTHVAGTVGGAMWGVAKGADLVAVRVLDCNGSGSNSGVVSGINWVAANRSGPSVINMSLGGGASTSTDTAVRNAHNAGVTVVVAAGNENQNACNVSPARAPEAITVGSTTSSDARSSFSNWGSCVDIMAPGSSIRSASAANNTGSTTMSGTSMASPHVAGAAALYLTANPSATPAQVASALTGNAVTGKLTGLNGSPNRLLNVSFIGAGGGGGGGGGGGPPPEEEPADGTPRTGTSSLSVARGAWRYYQPLPVLAGTTITVTLTGSGDPDLYLRFGAQPTTTQFQCASETPTATESCSITVPTGATQAYLGVYGYTAASYTLNASWVEP